MYNVVSSWIICKYFCCKVRRVRNNRLDLPKMHGLLRRAVHTARFAMHRHCDAGYQRLSNDMYNALCTRILRGDAQRQARVQWHWISRSRSLPDSLSLSFFSSLDFSLDFLLPLFLSFFLSLFLSLILTFPLSPFRVLSCSFSRSFSLSFSFFLSCFLSFSLSPFLLGVFSRSCSLIPARFPMAHLANHTCCPCSTATPQVPLFTSTSTIAQILLLNIDFSTIEFA